MQVVNMSFFLINLITFSLTIFISQTNACSGVVDLSDISDPEARFFSNNPTFPNGTYGEKARCRWIIRSGDNEFVKIKFEEIQIEQVWSGDQCGFDTLNIYETDLETLTNQIQDVEPCSKKISQLGLLVKGPICRLQATPDIHYTRTKLTMIEFCSDDSVEEKGFYATFEKLKKPNQEAEIREKHHGNFFTAASDVTPLSIASPVGKTGKHYVPNQLHKWAITTSEDYTISIEFQRFKLEDGLDCVYDSVIIYDGENATAPVLDKFCGSNKALRRIRTTQKNAFVEFRTDSWLQMQGFVLLATAVPCQSGWFFCGVDDICIPESKFCNGEKDCVDGRDETACGARCGIQQVQPRPMDVVLSSATKIVGGNEAKPHSWPWQVSLKWDIGDQFCAGSLIHPRFVVTAAHCIDGIDPDVLVIRLGSHDLTGDDFLAEDALVKKIVKHPDFRKATTENDIALIQLTKPIHLRREVLPVCLPHDETDDVMAGTICIATGWGDTEGFTIEEKMSSHRNFSKRSKQEEEQEEEEEILPKVLNEVALPVLSREECRTAYGDRLTDDMFCAGYMQGGKDSCQGDSGGPLVCLKNDRWILYGVVSWGDGCGSPRIPGIYARVSMFVPWIENTMLLLSRATD